MKKFKILLAISFIVISFVSCEKEENIPVNTGPFMIKQITKYWADSENSITTTFKYQGENLIAKETGSSKSEYSYNGDTITEILFSNSGDPSRKHDFFLKNGVMIEAIFYETGYVGWDIESKITFQYSGTFLTSWCRYNYEIHFMESGNAYYAFEPYEKGEYVYNNDKLVEYVEYRPNENSEWYSCLKGIYNYSDNILSENIYYSKEEEGDWEYSSKRNYRYSDDWIFKDIYGWYGSWEFYETERFKFNKGGYLIEEIDINSNKFIYEYEEGIGNAKLLWYYPYELVHNNPTLNKSASGIDYIPYHERTRNNFY